MKLKTSLVILLFSLALSVHAGKREQILIILSDPGLLTTVSYIKLGNEVIGSLRYMGRKFENSQFSVSTNEFDQLWELINSESYEVFIFNPSDDDNMSHPDFYNVTVNHGQQQTSLRVPRDSEDEKVELLRKFIAKSK